MYLCVYTGTCSGTYRYVKYTRTCSGDRDRDTGGDRGGHRPRDKDLPPMINATREQFLP